CRHRLTLLNRLIDRDHQQVLQVGQPFGVIGVNRFGLDVDRLHALMSGDDHCHRASAYVHFDGLVCQRFLCRQHVFLHLLKLAHHTHAATTGHSTTTRKSTTSFTHPTLLWLRILLIK